MGIRANYVILSSGRPSVYYSHWGGGNILPAFFYGPEEALSFIESAKPVQVESLLDEVWCEGAVCLDLDANELLVFEKESETVIRQLWLDLMHIIWKGWKITWCDNGILDIAERIGVDPASLMTESRTSADSTPSGLELLLWQTGIDIRKKERGHRKPWKEGALKMNQVIRGDIKKRDPAGNWITVATIGDGTSRRDYVIYRAGVPEVTACGSQIIEWFGAAEPVQLPQFEEMNGPRWPGGSLYAEPAAKRLYVGGGQGSLLSRGHVQKCLRSVWPGWEIEFHHLGMMRHLLLSGRDPYEWVPAAAVIKMLARAVLGGDSVNPERMLEQMTSSLAKDGVEHVIVNPDYFASGRGQIEDSRCELIFAEAVATWLRNRK